MRFLTRWMSWRTMVRRIGRERWRGHRAAQGRRPGRVPGLRGQPRPDGRVGIAEQVREPGQAGHGGHGLAGLQQVQHQRWMKDQILLGASGGRAVEGQGQDDDGHLLDGRQIDRAKLVGLTAGDVESTERACCEAILADARIEAAKLDREMESSPAHAGRHLQGSRGHRTYDESFRGKGGAGTITRRSS